MNFILHLLVTAAIVYGLSLILSPHFKIDGYGTAIPLVLLPGILNAILKLILV